MAQSGRRSCVDPPVLVLPEGLLTERVPSIRAAWTAVVETLVGIRPSPGSSWELGCVRT